MPALDTAGDVVSLITVIAKAIVEAYGQDYDEVMAELAKRHEIDGKASDDAAKDMDSHLPIVAIAADVPDEVE